MPREADVTVSGVGSFHLGPENYEILVQALNYSINSLEQEIQSYRKRVGGQSIYRDRIHELEIRKEHFINVLCAFDV
jgi:hypothetical protein